ncbi:hypothetical protein CHS0354_034888 [Potamilus streckersoni]|uniref:protein-tyrosine-phosphatase n=1 Tax=Potamilus streckersoni TaxID=2493646 RepID=A0AAE0S7P9_9BIVA|nr:hypothetical protein CHS0354_034888 [Potamilus streckersoni]
MVVIVSTEPPIPSWQDMFMLEAMTFKVRVVVDNPETSGDDICAQAWTNLYHRGNPSGEWHAIPLGILESITNLDNGGKMFVFCDSVILTSYGEEYRFTFRVRSKQSETWIWANDFMVDGLVKIIPPSDEKWTKGPEFSHIYQNIKLGNFMASSVADQLGFDAILNVADNLDLVPSKFSREIIYKKIPMKNGAGNKISDHMILEAVSWLDEQDALNKNTIVSCRAGIGRAGSTVVAYVFYKNPTWSFEQCYKFVFEKRFIYPHSGLEETLNKLYPRETLD